MRYDSLLACMLGLLLSMHHTFSLASDPTRDAHFPESLWHVLADVSSRQRCDFFRCDMVLQLRRNCDALTFNQCQRSDASSRHDQGDFRSYTSRQTSGSVSRRLLDQRLLHQATKSAAAMRYNVRACCVSLTILANSSLASSC